MINPNNCFAQMSKMYVRQNNERNRFEQFLGRQKDAVQVVCIVASVCLSYHWDDCNKTMTQAVTKLIISHEVMFTSSRCFFYQSALHDMCCKADQIRLLSRKQKYKCSTSDFEARLKSLHSFFCATDCNKLLKTCCR